jgi:alkylated DNA repair dioxygenase AlkB
MDLSDHVPEIPGIRYTAHFVADPAALYEELVRGVDWDTRMAARKTASFGKAYNYSQIAYPDQPFPDNLERLRRQLIPALGFEPNNCLINYYLDGTSKMGFHADQTDILHPETGVAIVSLGATRILRFKRITDADTVMDYHLASGSLFYMGQRVQEDWLHAIPKSDSDLGRISLTFRRLC